MEGSAITQGLSDNEAVKSTEQIVAVPVSLQARSNREERFSPNQNRSVAVTPCSGKVAHGTDVILFEMDSVLDEAFSECRPRRVSIMEEVHGVRSKDNART